MHAIRVNHIQKHLYSYSVKINVYLNVFSPIQKEQLVKTFPVPVLSAISKHPLIPQNFWKKWHENKQHIPSLSFKTIVIKIELTLLANTRRSSATAYMTGRALEGQKKANVSEEAMRSESPLPEVGMTLSSGAITQNGSQYPSKIPMATVINTFLTFHQ